MMTVCKRFCKLIRTPNHEIYSKYVTCSETEKGCASFKKACIRGHLGCIANFHLLKRKDYLDKSDDEDEDYNYEDDDYNYEDEFFGIVDDCYNECYNRGYLHVFKWQVKKSKYFQHMLEAKDDEFYCVNCFIEYDHLNCLEFVAKHGILKGLKYLRREAAFYEKSKILRFLIENGHNNDGNEIAIRRAIKHGKIEMLKIFLEYKIEFPKTIFNENSSNFKIKREKYDKCWNAVYFLEENGVTYSEEQMNLLRFRLRSE